MYTRCGSTGYCFMCYVPQAMPAARGGRSSEHRCLSLRLSPELCGNDPGGDPLPRYLALGQGGTNTSNE